MYFRKRLETGNPLGQLLCVVMTGLLFFSPVMEAVAQANAPATDQPGKVLVLDEKVGDTIDLEERNYYGLFLFIRDFHSATIRQLTDVTYVAEIVEVMDGERSTRSLPLDQVSIDRMQMHILGFERLHPAVRDSFSSLHRFIIKEGSPGVKPPLLQQTLSVTGAKQQAKELAKLEWSPERWAEESIYDRGGTSRAGGALLGCTLGAAAGMLIGKGLQERNVARTEHHSGGEWGTRSWTEDFYSYKNKNAPHVGAAVGGIVGSILGYWLGRKADKEYYILVPRHIRTAETKSTGFGNFVLGFVVLGPAVGWLAGKMLATPMSSRGSDTFDNSAALVGYSLGAILGTAAVAALGGRAKHRELWEQSLRGHGGNVSASIQVLPLDSETLSLNLETSPSGETSCAYHMDLVRIRF